MSRNLSIVLYPRTYNKRGPQNFHSVQGMTSNGDLINVKLRPDSNPSTSKGLSIMDLTHRDGFTCSASPNNAPDARDGVLIFHHAEYDGKNERDESVFVAKSVGVLAGKSESPSPILGHSRIDIKNKNAKTSALLKQIEKLNPESKECIHLKNELLNPANFTYCIVNYAYDKLFKLKPDKDELIKLFIQATECELFSNHIVGIGIRQISNNGKIIKDSYREFFSLYNNISEKYQSRFDFIKYLLNERFVSNGIISFFSDNSLMIEVIPIIKINAGRSLSAKLSSGRIFDDISCSYYTDESYELKSAQICRIAAKVDFYDGNYLLTEIHRASPPIGNPALLSKFGQFSTVSCDSPIAAPMCEQEMRIGGIAEELPVRLIWPSKGFSPNISKSMDETSTPTADQVHNTDTVTRNTITANKITNTLPTINVETDSSLSSATEKNPAKITNNSNEIDTNQPTSTAEVTSISKCANEDRTTTAADQAHNADTVTKNTITTNKRTGALPAMNAETSTSLSSVTEQDPAKITNNSNEIDTNQPASTEAIKLTGIGAFLKKRM